MNGLQRFARVKNAKALQALPILQVEDTLQSRAESFPNIGTRPSEDPWKKPAKSTFATCTGDEPPSLAFV